MRRAMRRLLVVTSSLVALAACAKVAGIDQLQIGECKGGVCGDEAGTLEGSVRPPPSPDGDAPRPDGGGLGDAANIPCPGMKGPSMVRVGSASNNFCIDSTEVTVAQYREFTAAKGGDVTGQGPECVWNASYAAGLGGADDIPIAGIDWCDAVAYCKWAGKRLCGKHAAGAFVGPVGVEDLADYNTHEWLAACSSAGQNRYPYGAVHKPTACNTGELDAGKSLPVGSQPECAGGFPGVFDMVGNLWEWYDGPCLPPDAGPDGDAGDGGPQKLECYVKGGAFVTSGTNIDCRVDGRGAARDRRGQEIGMRCCSD